MKKKIFGIVLILAIVTANVLNVGLNLNSKSHDISLANIEALAQSNNNEKMNNGFSTIECNSSSSTDPKTGFITIIEYRRCEGDGTKECKCS